MFVALPACICGQAGTESRCANLQAEKGGLSAMVHPWGDAGEFRSKAGVKEGLVLAV